MSSECPACHGNHYIMVDGQPENCPVCVGLDDTPVDRIVAVCEAVEPLFEKRLHQTPVRCYGCFDTGTVYFHEDQEYRPCPQCGDDK